MRELLDAGYLEDWKFHQTLSGVPQGGVVSPILSNILLDKLDKYVETYLIPRYTKGDKKRANEKYAQLIKQAHYQRKQGHTQVAEQLRRQAQKLPSGDPADPNYRRLRYVRYADDFLLGFIGTRWEAEEIKQQLRRFLREELKLELSEEKTLITHAVSEAARFLGYEITVLQDDTKRTKRRDTGRMCRSINRVIGLRVPEDVLKAKIDRYRENGEATHRTELIKASDYTIVLTYQLEFRGSANDYQLAYNRRSLAKLKWVMEASLTKTLASKHKISVSKVYEKYEAMLLVEDKEYKGLQVTQPKPDESKKPLLATWGAIPLKWNSEAPLDDQPPRVPINHRTELVQRLLADFCELCGSDKDVEVHHVNAMRKLHEYPGRAKPEWVKRMIALRRKTLVLCKRCHVAVEHGLPITWQLISLDEIKEQRKKLNDTILESRMH